MSFNPSELDATPQDFGMPVVWLEHSVDTNYTYAAWHVARNPNSEPCLTSPQEVFAPPRSLDEPMPVSSPSSSSSYSSSKMYCPPPAFRTRHALFPTQTPMSRAFTGNASHDSEQDTPAPAQTLAINPMELDEKLLKPRKTPACYTCCVAKKRCDRNVDGCRGCNKRGFFCFYPTKSYQGHRTDLCKKTGASPNPQYNNHVKYKEDTAAVLAYSRKSPPRAFRASKSKCGTRKARRSVR